MPEEETKHTTNSSVKELVSDTVDKPKKLLTDYFPSSRGHGSPHPPLTTAAKVESSQNVRKKKSASQHNLSSPLRKEMIEKIIQTDEVVRLLDEIISEAPLDDYWYKMAEKKRVELEEALAENERLFKIKDALLQQNKYYKMMLEEANTFITVFTEVADDAADDTGIELEDNDCSE